jgi:hypothetical protein
MVQGLPKWASPPDSHRGAAKKWRKVARFEVFFEHPYITVHEGVKRGHELAIVHAMIGSLSGGTLNW